MVAALGAATMGLAGRGPARARPAARGQGGPGAHGRHQGPGRSHRLAPHRPLPGMPGTGLPKVATLWLARPMGDKGAMAVPRRSPARAPVGQVGGAADAGRSPRRATPAGPPPRSPLLGGAGILGTLAPPSGHRRRCRRPSPGSG